MEIDVVVPWVDGSDPKHREKRAHFLKTTEEGAGVEAAAIDDKRFVQNDEIRYCLRSIHNHAPWVRRVHLITDDQYPDSIDERLAEKYGIFRVDHRTLFAGCEDLLPTFSTRAIQAMTWRIAGLSEYFISFDDDMFFGKPALPELFFRDGKPIYRGAWRPIRGLQEAGIYEAGLMNAALAINPAAERYFHPAHLPAGHRVSVFEKLADEFPERFRAIAAGRFRDRSQFQPNSLFINHAIHHGIADHEEPGKRFGKKISGNASARNFKSRLRLRMTLRAMSRNRFSLICLNNWPEVEKRAPKLEKAVARACGPAAPFERCQVNV